MPSLSLGLTDLIGEQAAPPVGDAILWDDNTALLWDDNDKVLWD